MSTSKSPEVVMFACYAQNVVSGEIKRMLGNHSEPKECCGIRKAEYIYFIYYMAHETTFSSPDVRRAHTVTV